MRAQTQSHLRFPPGVCRLVQICFIPIVEFASQVQAPVSASSHLDTVAKTWAAIRRRFRRRGVRLPRQLLLGSSYGVPESMRKKPAWLELFRRALRVVAFKRLFPRLNRPGGEGVPDVAVHQAFVSDVLRGLRQADVQIGSLFTDNRWRASGGLCEAQPLDGAG